MPLLLAGDTGGEVGLLTRPQKKQEACFILNEGPCSRVDHTPLLQHTALIFPHLFPYSSLFSVPFLFFCHSDVVIKVCVSNWQLGHLQPAYLTWQIPNQGKGKENVRVPEESHPSLSSVLYMPVNIHKPLREMGG